MEVKKTISYIFSVAATLTLIFLFQNCSDELQSKTSSNGGGTLPVDVEQPNELGDGDGEVTIDPGDETGSGDPSTSLSFDLGRGDSIMYLYQAGAVQTIISDAIKYTNKHGSALETIETNVVPQANETDLPASYCQDSALPHCRHINGDGCQGEACILMSNLRVQCSYEKFSSQNDLSALFNLISGLQIQNRVQETPPVMVAEHCDTPSLHFFSDAVADARVSLAPLEACVENGKLLANPASSAALKMAEDSKIAGVKAKGDYCNNYARRWYTTKFVYDVTSGLTTAAQSYSHHIEYDGAQRANLRYRKPGDTTTYCASAQLLNVSEINAFFPDAGLSYKVLKTDLTFINDGPTTQIEYSDSDDGMKKWKFFLDDTSAYMGGAVLSQDQATAQKAAVESLINRAEALGQSAACP